MKKIDNILSNFLCVPIILLLGFWGWAYNIDTYIIPILAVYTLAVFVFCKDVKNILPIIFSVPFFISSVESNKINILAVSLAIFVIGAIYYTIKQFVTQKDIKKGKMFWAFVVALCAYLLGGVFVNFNLINSLIIIGLTLATYFIYWISINFCKDIAKYIAQILICIGVMLTVQMLIEYLQVENSFAHAILSKNVIWIGIQHINTVAIYLALAMASAFYLGFKNKFDYLFAMIALYFAGCTYFTYARLVVLICFVTLVSLMIYTFVKSQNKKKFIIFITFVIFIIGIQILVLYKLGFRVFERVIEMGYSGNGRQILWPWCWDKFKGSPLFGIGFVSEEDPVPTLVSTDSIVLAHNSVLQYLTSLGIIGTLMMGYFYFKKYKILLSKLNTVKLFNLIQVLIIAFAGIVDQAPTMDVFILSISFVFIAIAETDDGKDLFAEKWMLKKAEKEKINTSNTK